MNINSWESFISFLDNKINWDNPQSSDLNLLETALREIAKYRDDIYSLVNKVANSKSLMDSYEQHMEFPRLFMNKFVLHMDPADRYRVRIHSFRTTRENRNEMPNVHDHRWHYATIVLKGQYEETIYETIEDNDNQTAQFNVIKKHVLKEGDANSLAPRIPHLTVNTSDDTQCITLFVRGKSFYKTSKVYNLEKGTFYELRSRKMQIIKEMQSLASSIMK